MARLLGTSRLLVRGCHGLAPPEKVVVMHKISQLEWERRRTPGTELARKLSVSSPDYQLLLQRHTIHNRSLDDIQAYLQSRGVAVRMRDRGTYCSEDVEWADVIFAAGGDGNFLFTASKVFSAQKIVIGLNTDPSRSEGFLCLCPPPGGSLGLVLDQVFRGEVQETLRQRVRITMGPSLLPVRALNEVFIGEKDHSHASYYDLSYDGSCPELQKSSGLLIYTGTGSTSWAYNVNKITTVEVQRLFELAQGEGLSLPQNTSLDTMAANVTEAYNTSNVFSGSKQRMAFTVREPIIRGIFAACKTQGHADSISVCSRSWNANLVVDGHTHFDFPRGETVTCTLHPEDVLRTVGIQRPHKHKHR